MPRTSGAPVWGRKGKERGTGCLCFDRSGKSQRKKKQWKCINMGKYDRPSFSSLVFNIYFMIETKIVTLSMIFKSREGKGI